MSALKFVCATDNLVDFLSLGDSVEFDAEYCDKTVIKDRYWKATLVKVTRKSSLGRNKYQVNFDTEEYTEKRLVKEKFNGVPKSRNACINRSNQRHISSPSNISSVKENLHSNKEISTLKSESNKLLFLPHDDTPCDKTECSVTEGDGFDEEIIKDETIQVLRGHNIHKNSLSLDIYETDNENSSFTPDSDKMDLQYSTTCPEENVIVKNIPITGSSFTFGEIVVITDKEGIAISLNSGKQSEVYFKEKSVLYFEESQISPQEGSKALLFLPYGLKESSISVATLVYVLDEEESSLVDGNFEWVDDFAVEYFIPKLKLRYPNYINCVCNFGFSFSAPSESLDEELCFPDFLNDLRKVCTYDGNTGKNSLAVLKLQNSKIDKDKRASFQTSIFSSLDPSIEYSQPKEAQISINCRDNLTKELEAVPQTNNENNISLSCPSIRVEGMQTEDTISSSTVPIQEYNLSTPDVNSRNPSTNSPSSYVSCDAVSDEEFFSLESSSSKSSSNQDTTKSKYSASEAEYLLPETEISTPEKEGPSITDESKNQEKDVPTTTQICQLKNILSDDNFCQCQYKSVESTASISMITDKCFYLDVKDNKDVALSFPMCLIPEEVQDQIKLNSELSISFALHQLVQVSQILYLKFKLNNKVQFCIDRR